MERKLIAIFAFLTGLCFASCVDNSKYENKEITVTANGKSEKVPFISEYWATYDEMKGGGSNGNTFFCFYIGNSYLIGRHDAIQIAVYNRLSDIKKGDILDIAWTSYGWDGRETQNIGGSVEVVGKNKDHITLHLKELKMIKPYEGIVTLDGFATYIDDKLWKKEMEKEEKSNQQK